MTSQQLVKSWMTSQIVTINVNESLIEADAIMREYGIRRLPVVDNHNRLMGIITKGDVREASPSDATTLSIWEVNYLISKLKVKDVMTRTPLTITPDADIIDAAEIMLNQKVSGLPVLEGGAKLVGIITESDIFRMLVTTRLQTRETVS